MYGSQAYLEPKYRGLSYKDIKVPAQPIQVRLTVYGKTNGKEHERISQFWRRQVERALTASRVFEISETARSSLVVTVNNVGDMGSAVGKGVMTGMTLGAVGSLVTDGYIMTVEFTPDGGTPFKGTYNHAIYTSIENADGPKGVKPVLVQEAPNLVGEDMTLHFLKELEQQSATTPATPTQPSEPASAGLGVLRSALALPFVEGVARL